MKIKNIILFSTLALLLTGCTSEIKELGEKARDQSSLIKEEAKKDASEMSLEEIEEELEGMEEIEVEESLGALDEEL